MEGTKKSVITEGHITTVATVIQEDRNVSVRLLERQLNIPKSTIHRMRSQTFYTKFNSEQLLFEAFFHVMFIFGSVEQIECILLYSPIHTRTT